ncbi:MAG: 4Fe-4S binding protein [Eubacteriales bacterium]
MKKSVAVRNVRLCTKDCICLYVCPTGATDTENSIIDVDKCIGCGACANACPSHAISMVPTKMPPQQEHKQEVIDGMLLLLHSKSKQEAIATKLEGRLAKAIEQSNRIMAEDIIREAGYMLPQSSNVNEFLKDILVNASLEEDAKKDVEQLLKLIEVNETIKVDEKEEVQMSKYKCSVCNYIHEGALTEGFACPICKQPASVFVKMD